MKKDRSNWTVRKVSFAEADALDNEYYGSLTDERRLEILFELRDLIETGENKIAKFVFKRKIDEEEI